MISTSPEGMPLKSRWWSEGMQTALDCTILLSAFVVAYLLRFDFALPQAEQRRLLIQVPMVVLFQFVALTITGARAYIWRYTCLNAIRSFFYSFCVGLIMLTLVRLGLPESYQAWRMPLSINLMDSMLAFGGAFGMRVLRRAVYERGNRMRLSDDRNDQQNGPHKQSVSVTSNRRRIQKAPGSLILKVANFLCSAKSMKLTVAPLIADWRSEFFAALHDGRQWKSRWITLSYYVHFAKTLTIATFAAILKDLGFT